MAARRLSSPSGHRIDVQLDRRFRSTLRAAWLRRIARRVLAAEGVAPAALSIVIADEATVHELNRRYLGVDRPTDVLSFGLSQGSDTAFVLPPGEVAPLGEVIICYPVAIRQAAERGDRVQAEVAHLLVHGILHLLGYDHLRPEDERVMGQREKEILADLAAAPF